MNLVLLSILLILKLEARKAHNLTKIVNESLRLLLLRNRMYIGNELKDTG